VSQFRGNQNRHIQCGSVLNTTANILCVSKASDLSTSWIIVSCWRRTMNQKWHLIIYPGRA